MLKKACLSLILCLPFVAFSSRAAAQNETGAYLVYVGGQLVAEENYAAEKLADGNLRTAARIGTNSLFTTTRNNLPVEFAVEAGGTRVLTTTFAGGEAKTVIAGQPEKIVKTSASVVLENGVWSQFIDLLAQYDANAGGVQNLIGFLPSQTLELPLTLEKLDTRDFKINGQLMPLSIYRLVHSRGGLIIQIIADRKAVPVLIEIPAQSVRAVKKGFEELLAVNSSGATAAIKTFRDEFTREEVSIRNGEITLAGTLTIPKNDRKSHPAVVIISGSGAQDRDGSGGLFDLYKLIAESLSRAGIAVLRADDRGAGRSTIVREKAAETSYRDLISDSRAAFDYLTARPEIDKTRIALLGHSEGAETALTIAAEDDRVAAIMLLAGVSRPIDHTVLEQELFQRAMQETVNVSDKTKIMPVAQGLVRQFEEAKLPQNAGDPRLSWFRQHLESNPRQLAQKVKCPVLILQGERDVLVLAYHSIELANALVSGGNKEVSLRILPNLTHIFTPVSENREEAAKISGEFLRALQNWAAATLNK